VNYLGFPGTMAAPYMDYILADRVVIPPDEQVDYQEKVIYLPHSYQANDSNRTISERTPSRVKCGLPESGFVFCCFNNSYKITPRLFDIWMRLLRAVDGSVLWLFEANAKMRENLRAEAERRGVAADRLVFAKHANLEDHLARYQLADLVLDTLPYGAHTTASDALWAGTPIVACRGTAFAGRVSASLLRAIELPELITGSLYEYEALALKLAQDRTLLSEVKGKLASKRKTAPLFDTDLFCRHVEAAFTQMWERYQRGKRPESFSV
jgi:predicted O-linked N-acetylglucosamine transferase (SPINDLY family)